MRSISLALLAACAGHGGAVRDPGPPCVDVQLPTATDAIIYGIVLDERGLAMPGVQVRATSRDPLDELGFPVRATIPPPRRHVGPDLRSARTNELGQYRLALRPVVYDVRFTSPELQVEWRGVLPDLGRAHRLDVDLGELPDDDWNLVLDTWTTATTSSRARECPP
jgi:hypothetical protein